MTRDDLIRVRKASWDRLGDLLLRTKGARGAGKLTCTEIGELSELYRSLASDLMRVRRDRLGRDLEAHLDALASQAHNVMYARSDVRRLIRPLEILVEFPGAVRRNMRLFLLASALFYVPLLAVGYAAYVDESYALSIMSDDDLESVERMYRFADAKDRNVETNSAMTGFYVWNNVGIAFRCFATGLLFGLGPIFFLLMNGLMIGTVGGHLARLGLGTSLFSFVACHSAWELTAIVISGAAGMQMGYALVATNGRTRWANLRAHVPELLRQVMGAAAFLLIAALLEGNVSPSPLPNGSKYAMGAVGWLLVAAILLGAGRQLRVPADVVALRKKVGSA